MNSSGTIIFFHERLTCLHKDVSNSTSCTMMKTSRILWTLHNSIICFLKFGYYSFFCRHKFKLHTESGHPDSCREFPIDQFSLHSAIFSQSPSPNDFSKYSRPPEYCRALAFRCAWMRRKIGLGGSSIFRLLAAFSEIPLESERNRGSQRENMSIELSFRRMINGQARSARWRSMRRVRWRVRQRRGGSIKAKYNMLDCRSGGQRKDPDPESLRPHPGNVIFI